MNCRTCTNQLSAYIDERLEADQRAAFEAHMADCAECATQLRVARASSLALRSEPQAVPPEGLAARAARAALTANDRVDKRSFLERWIPIAAPTTALAAIAAAALLVLGPKPAATSATASNGDDPLGLVSDVGQSEDLAGDILALGEE